MDGRWIRTNNGFAGRNGYLIKVKGGYNGYLYGDAEFFTFNLAAEGKRFLDNSKATNLDTTGL